MVTEREIDSAIDYALRHSPPVEVQCNEDGDFDVEITEAAAVKDFVMAVLRDLKVIP